MCEAVADLTDSKALESGHHSRLVAETADRIGAALSLPHDDRRRLRQAALVHDVGKMAIPYATLRRASQGQELTGGRFRAPGGVWPCASGVNHGPEPRAGPNAVTPS